MSYENYSVREAVESINANVNGWFLPTTQRPYVWGSRYENEMYICKLFDSLLRGFPIGGIILWNTGIKIAYREFFSDYNKNFTSKNVESGRWSKPDKHLVYDGQQRMQTLYSCLKYTFNDRVLIYNLLFDLDNDIEPDETGFSFVDANSIIPTTSVRMNHVFIQEKKDQFDFQEKIFAQCQNITPEQRRVVGRNITELWNIFVEIGIKSIAYFKIRSDDEASVNEIFQRLNSGGMALTQSDLLFSRVKEKYYDFEEDISEACKEILIKTGNGYHIEPSFILQIINLLIKGTIRIDSKKIKANEIDSFYSIWSNIKEAIIDFFSDFIFGNFKINNSLIIPKKIALIPIVVYFNEIYKKGFCYRDFNDKILLKLKQYFILSQINDWNLQSMGDNFARLILKKSDKSKQLFEFPLDDIIQFIEDRKLRNTGLYLRNFQDYTWFSLKVLLPDDLYVFLNTNNNRFNPEIDHIFPKKLKGMDDSYKIEVDILWNLQPLKGVYNLQKSNIHPRDFFQSPNGIKYLPEYKFMPSKDLNDPIYDNHMVFIQKRKELMIEYMKEKYNLSIEE